MVVSGAGMAGTTWWVRELDCTEKIERASCSSGCDAGGGHYREERMRETGVAYLLEYYVLFSRWSAYANSGVFTDGGTNLS
jgi:hypothetical protein